MFKGTMTKWPVQKLAQGTTQKLFMTQQTFRKHIFLCHKLSTVTAAVQCLLRKQNKRTYGTSPYLFKPSSKRLHSIYTHENEKTDHHSLYFLHQCFINTHSLIICLVCTSSAKGNNSWSKSDIGNSITRPFKLWCVK